MTIVVEILANEGSLLYLCAKFDITKPKKQNKSFVTNAGII